MRLKRSFESFRFLVFDLIKKRFKGKIFDLNKSRGKSFIVV